MEYCYISSIQNKYFSTFSVVSTIITINNKQYCYLRCIINIVVKIFHFYYIKKIFLNKISLEEVKKKRNMKLEVVAVVLLYFAFAATRIVALQLDESIEKASFKKYFAKAYKLRLKNNNNNTSSTTTKATKLHLSRRSLKDGKKLLEDAFGRYQQTSKHENFQKVARNGTTDQKLDIISEEIWDRTGGEIVEKTLIATGTVIGSQIGGYVGGTLGMAIGVMVPPLQIPLVIGGVFIGKNLGKVLGAIGGKIASDFVNNFIADNLIGKLVINKLYPMIVGNISKASKSDKVTCRSDICSAGLVESRCKCVSCNGPMQYSDKDGLSSCKSCQLGSYPIRDYYRRNVDCRKCPQGSIGKSDGKCYNCVGLMEYGDMVGATSCKTCNLGTIPFHDYYQRNVGCKSCIKGTIGKNDGICYRCDGPMEYGDDIGSTSCKQCTLGTVPLLDYNRRHVGCKACRKSTFGKDDGNCHWCDGPMEYGDEVGATSCKQCTLGTVPLLDYNQRHVGCRQCKSGTIGKSDGKCHPVA